MDKLKRRRVGYQNCHSVALVSGDNDGVLGVVVLMVLQIVAGLVSALLSISRLTLTGQSFTAEPLHTLSLTKRARATSCKKSVYQ